MRCNCFMKTESILVADDDPDAIRLLEVGFEREAPDIRLVHVPDGTKAIAYLEAIAPEAVRTDRPELLLLDLKMPLADGFEVLEWLRNKPKHRPKHVVVFSGSDQLSDKRRARSLGADAYLVKALSFDELRQQVKALATCVHSGVRLPEIGDSDGSGPEESVGTV